MTIEQRVQAHMSADELELWLELEGWEATLTAPPSIFQVLETGDGRLIGAYILRGFRAAARAGVSERHRVMELRDFAYLAFDGAKLAERFLTELEPTLNDQSPLQAAVASGEGRDNAILSLAPQLRFAAARLIDRIVRAWKLHEDELAQLLGGDSSAIRLWNEQPGEMPIHAVELVSMLLGVLRSAKLMYVPVVPTETWIRSGNDDAPFHGQSPLAFMIAGGLTAMRQVRRYLDDRAHHLTRREA
jgi:hypothetical protein